jgi:ACR3 family arsenite efflux pump ArsB
MVAFNSVLQIILYAPLSIFYLRVRHAAAAPRVLAGDRAATRPVRPACRDVA